MALFGEVAIAELKGKSLFQIVLKIIESASSNTIEKPQAPKFWRAHRPG